MTNPMGTFYKGPILWEHLHVQRTNPMGTLTCTKNQSYGNTNKGSILWEHVQMTNSLRTRI